MLGAVGEAELQVGRQGPQGDEFGEEQMEDLEDEEEPHMSSSRFHIPEIDPQELDIQQGELMRKSKGMLHKWQTKFAIIDLHTLTLDFFKKQEDFQKGRRPQASILLRNCEVQEGSNKTTHNSKKVAFPFMITDKDGDETQLSAEDEDTQQAWINTVQYIRDLCQQGMFHLPLQVFCYRTSSKHDEICSSPTDDTRRHPRELEEGPEEEESEGASALDEEEEERMRDFAQNQTAWGTVSCHRVGCFDFT